ncbi:MAG: helix-turn-helix transcriptional regulator [Oscillospiraceae bacterium]|nr:helix-turn-helix transcriptional regulator [Oscillospiraceae bacterium]
MNGCKNYKEKTSGSLVRELRKAAGLTQPELAEKIGCDFQTISNIENDRYLSADKALKISKFFHVPVDYILGKIDNPDEYVKMFMSDISLMSRTVKARETIVEYLTVSEGNRKLKLSESEKQLLMDEIMWYGRARLQKLIKDRENGNGEEQGK